jgi:hypothetical protein
MSKLFVHKTLATPPQSRLISFKRFITVESQQLHHKTVLALVSAYTDKRENNIFLIYKEIQKGAVAKSNMTDGLIIDD